MWNFTQSFQICNSSYVNIGVLILATVYQECTVSLVSIDKLHFDLLCKFQNCIFLYEHENIKPKIFLFQI